LAISPENRREILLRSFELLKDNWNNNGNSLREILEKMWPIDSDMATNMWLYLLKKHKSFIQSDGLGINACILSSGIQGIGLAKITDIAISNETLKSALFEKTDWVSDDCAKIVGFLINTNRLVVANDLLELVRKNKVNYRVSFAEFLMEVIENTNNPEKSDEIYEYFLEWSKSMGTQEDSAKIGVKLLDLFEK
jgi:hypothetical protein